MCMDYFMLRTDVERPELRPVTDLTGQTMLAMRVKWRSWVWQVQLLRKASFHIEPAIRLVADGPPARVEVGQMVGDLVSGSPPGEPAEAGEQRRLGHEVAGAAL